MSWVSGKIGWNKMKWVTQFVTDYKSIVYRYRVCFKENQMIYQVRQPHNLYPYNKTTSKKAYSPKLSPTSMSKQYRSTANSAQSYKYSSPNH